MRILRNGFFCLSEYFFVNNIFFINFNLVFFSRYDLYTKSEKIPDIEKLWPYYQSLIDKYLPGDIEF